MAELSELYPDIRLEVEGCPISVIDRAIQQTVRHFCRETWYWLHDIEPLTLQAFVEAAPSTYFYELDVPEDAEVLGIDGFEYHKNPLLMKSDSWLDEHLSGWRQAAGDPRYFIAVSDRRIRLVPASNKVQPMAVTGTLALKPKRRARTFGDILLDYDQGLTHGVLARLMAMNKPWNNLQRTQTAQAVYLDAISDAKSKVMQRFSSGVETAVQRSWL